MARKTNTKKQTKHSIANGKKNTKAAKHKHSAHCNC